MGKSILIITVLFLVFGILPSLTYAYHSLNFEVDKPNGYYARGQPVTFTIANAGQDNAYVECPGIQVYDGAGGPVATESNECYTPTGSTVAVAYEINAGNSHTWKWDQKYKNGGANDGTRVPDAQYDGSIMSSNLQAQSIHFTTSNFHVEKDSDGDGITDSQDACPNDAKNFCAAAQDSDGDGTPDVSDPCPNDAKDSCADGDPDKDGIKNYQDNCPTQAGPSEAGGCPDKDGDGIPDSVDKCPTQKEDKNGYKDDDGCPDAGQKDAKNKACTIALIAGGLAILFTYLAAGSIAVPPLAILFGILAAGTAAIAFMINYVYGCI